MAPDIAPSPACIPQEGVGASHLATGGTVVFQDPESSEFSGMPRTALRSVAADHVLALETICPALVRLVTGEARG